MKSGLLAPKNYDESTGGLAFKEGIRRVTAAAFRVEQAAAFGGDAQREPHVALVLTCERLDDDLDPMVDEVTGEAMSEDLSFGIGGKSLGKVHPASATGPEDDEPEDAGAAPGSEGPTLVVLDDKWKMNGKSGLAHLNRSLDGKLRPEFFETIWAPQYVGLVAFFKSLPDEAVTMKDRKTGLDRAIAFKVVDKVIKAPYDAKGKKGAGTVKDANGGDWAAGLLDTVLKEIATEQEGEALTVKGLSAAVSAKVNKSGETKLLVPVQTLLKSEGWLEGVAKTYGFVLDREAGTVQF